MQEPKDGSGGSFWRDESSDNVQMNTFQRTAELTTAMRTNRDLQEICPSTMMKMIVTDGDRIHRPYSPIEIYMTSPASAPI